MAQGTCRECGRTGIRFVGRGLCGACYDRHWKRRTLDLYPIQPRPKPPPRVEKACAICKRLLPLDAFAKTDRRRDGRGSYCRSCARAKYQLPARKRKLLVERPTQGEQVCHRCGVEKQYDAFDWQRDKGRYAYRCKVCRKASEKSKHEADPTRRRESNLRRKYGLSLAEFSVMVTAQGGGCAICGTAVNPDGYSLAVDHCHDTGRVRGILCGPCNKAIGLLRDDPALLREAVRYLEAG